MKFRKHRSLSVFNLNDTQSIYLDDRGRSPGFFCRDLPVRISRQIIEQLYQESEKRGGVNVRLCLHNGPDADFHSMIILERKGGKYPPHKHLKKGESMHIIQGELAVFSFDEQGSLDDCCILQLDSVLIYRVRVAQFHSIMPLTDVVIYHESTIGPFLGEENSILPEWAPDKDNQDQTDKFNERLLKAVQTEKKLQTSGMVDIL